VIVIPADGDMGGDYMQGLEMCLHRIAERLVDPDAQTRPMTVNLIGELGVGFNTDVNFRTVKGWLDALGIGIGCRFLGDAGAEEVRRLTAAPLNILAGDSADGRALRSWLEERYGCRFFPRCLPIGFDASRSFLEELGGFFGVADRVAPIVEREAAQYDAEVARLRPLLRGKRLFMTTINTSMD
jgi:nitrogenase molybdenum-iron protein alpha/beta subunit